MPTNFEHPREWLYRMHVPISEFRVASDDDGDGRTLIGYAARFNSPTRITGWEGEFDETIQRGAFGKTIAERADRIKVLFDHGLDSRYGNAPIGKIDTIREDESGLWVEVRLANTEAGRDIAELVRIGAIDGMSFRFSVIKEEWDESGDTPLRTLIEVRLYELGPVTFPAYEATTAGVRSAEGYRAFRAEHHPSSTEPAAATPPATTEPVEPAFDATRANNRIPVIRGRIHRYLKEHS